uniref:Ycf20 n=1 Tax=Chroomonas placoidea TaxID=173977 RepID=A0A222AI62_9CRYP|nr:hypothetical protein [Chroomonas placoidea]ASO76039.1 hypothetical protein [Chroomonas placoidea]
MNLITRVFKRIYYKFLFSKKFFYSTFVSFIAILLGFFLANALATMLGQTGDWGVLSSGILVALIESTNRIVYNNKKKFEISFPCVKFYFTFLHL